MCNCLEFFYKSSDGKTNIRAMRWQCEDTEPRAVLQISHGICEHIGRYDTYARFMARHGFIVVANDHLGHGKSYQEDERRGFFALEDGWMTVVEDMHLLYQLTHEQFPRLPYFMLGHSMGSFLARTYVIRHQNNLSGVLISGTGQPAAATLIFGIKLTERLMESRGPMHRSNQVTALCFGTYNRHFMPMRTLHDWLSRDELLIDAHIADEMCNFTPTVTMYRDMFSGMRYMSSSHNLDRMQKDLPVLFFSGSMDPVGEEGTGVQRSVISFIEAGCQDISLRMYPGGRHEMLNEINRDEVYDDILRWINSKR